MLAKKGRVFSEETRRKISEANKGRHFSPETEFKGGHEVPAGWRKNWSEKNKGKPGPMKGKKQTEEAKRNMSESRKLLWENFNYHQRMVEVHKGQVPSELNKKRRAASMQINWKDPDYRRRVIKAVMRGMHIRPTEPEKKLLDLIKKYNFPFRYCGDGDVVIGRKCPDFINNKGRRQVIEMFGDYWHSPLLNPNMRSIQGYNATIRHYSEYGFETLIIWEHELEDEMVIVNKIKGLTF